MRYALFFIVGVIVTLIVLKILKKKVAASESTIQANFIAMAKTPQFKNFILTPQGKELAKTPQFKKLFEGAIIETIASTF